MIKVIFSIGWYFALLFWMDHRQFGCIQKFFDTVERAEVPQEWTILLKNSPIIWHMGLYITIMQVSQYVWVFGFMYSGTVWQYTMQVENVPAKQTEMSLFSYFKKLLCGHGTCTPTKADTYWLQIVLKALTLKLSVVYPLKHFLKSWWPKWWLQKKDLRWPFLLETSHTDPFDTTASNILPPF